MMSCRGLPATASGAIDRKEAFDGLTGFGLNLYYIKEMVLYDSASANWLLYDNIDLLITPPRKGTDHGVAGGIYFAS